MSNRITKAEVARLRELERQAGDHVSLMLFRASRDLLPSLLDTLDEAMAALAAMKRNRHAHNCSCEECERARALLADYGKEG